MASTAQRATLVVTDYATGGGQRVDAARLTTAIAVLLAIVIAAVFVVVLLTTIDFPLGTQADESSKVDSLLNGQNPSYHPILMLQVVRMAKALTGLSDPQALVELGRRCAVLAGGFAIVSVFFLARAILPIPTALATALAVAVVPLTTVHARYFKEDIFMLPFVLLSLLSLVSTLRSPTPARGVLLGLTIGLAAASKYVAAAILPFALVILLISPSQTFKERAQMCTLVAVIAIAVFCAVELPAFLDFGQFQSALRFELRHASQGHDVRLPIAYTYGLFHLRESLLPGLGLPLLVLGLFGLSAPWLAPPDRTRPLLVMGAFALLWYAMHEVSPLKPYPGYARYMLPLAPLLIILGAAFVHELLQHARLPSVLAALAVLAAALPAVYFSLLINGPPAEDLRLVVPPTVIALEPRTVFDSYTRISGIGGVGRQASIKAPATPATDDILVTSNFTYDRYTRFGDASMQPKDTRSVAAYYAYMFQQPYLEVNNHRPSYGFFNPVIRIVELDGRRDRLDEIAAALRRSHPTLDLKFSTQGREVTSDDRGVVRNRTFAPYRLPADR
jgi:4-amino-4-deoxy-L-arabinose transferase-like glycosyltransferase